MDSKKVASHIVGWLKNYLQSSNTNGFVIGVSGGIDSALTSTLVAMTAYPVLCVDLPIHQSPSQQLRARNHIKNLKAKYPNVQEVEVDLTSVFDELVNSFPASPDNSNIEMSLVNARARLRMTSLYYFAGLHSYLVAGTGNKVEDFGVGFYTKYGDGGVDLSPIADLSKTEVYELSEYLGINNEILVAPPTDGLWGDDRTDEDQIGASYPELEWAMERQAEGKSISDFEGREKEVYEIYSRLNKQNQHKMMPIPVCEIPKHLLK